MSSPNFSEIEAVLVEWLHRVRAEATEQARQKRYMRGDASNARTEREMTPKLLDALMQFYWADKQVRECKAAIKKCREDERCDLFGKPEYMCEDCLARIQRRPAYQAAIKDRARAKRKLILQCSKIARTEVQVGAHEENQ